ncbi:MAG: hypothetical protein KAJ29_04060 [Alphaproteobacteria bacterium]|nr:hypothetical protein [Alphaproteobacteria bacterium]
MASMTPLLMSTAINLAVSQASNETAAKNLERGHALEESRAGADAALERTAIKQNAAADEKQRKSALRRAVSSQKASFGAQGVGSDGGSSEAVLLGMVNDFGEDQEKDDNVTSLKLAAIDQNLRQQKALNVLQRSQLEEKNNLSLISRIL